MRIEFPFVANTPAAIFRRADTLWLVFDSEATVDLAALKRDAGDAIREAHFERSKDGAAIVRLRLARPRLTGVLNDGPAWIVDVGDAVIAPTKQLSIARSIAGKNRASIAIPFDDARKVHRITDPAVGDRLMVITALAPARGFLKGQDFVELRALPSAHGVVVQPLADDLSAELAADKITISRPLGLALSPTAIGQQQLATSFRAMTFDTQLWGFDRNAEFNKRQSDLIHAAAMAPLQKRRAARLDLARFYLARDMSAEALAVLDVTLSDERGADDITATVLKAIACVMLGRPDEALKALSNPQVGNQLDAPLWRAVAYARQGKWADAHDRFKETDAALGTLPIELQRMTLRYALRASIEVHDFNGADKVLNELQTIGVPEEEAPAIAVLVGQLSEAHGAQRGRAHQLPCRRSVERPPQRRRRTIARNHAALCARRHAAQGGDRPPRNAHHRLARRRDRGGRPETVGASLHRGRPLSRSLPCDALGHAGASRQRSDPQDPGRGGGELREPVPGRQKRRAAAGRGARLVLRLPRIDADRPARRRDDPQARRPAGVGRSARSGGRIAAAPGRSPPAGRGARAGRHAPRRHLPDEPQARPRARRVAHDPHRRALSNELRDQRLLLEARALSETGRHDLALEIIADIQGRQATRLRADILWAARKWREAAEQIELLYGERWREFTPLSESERGDILRAAIGYALGDEPIGLGRLREKYAAKLADTPDRHAFEVVSAPTGADGKEFKDVARAVAGMNTLDSFLRDMRTRYPDAVGDGADGAGDKTAPDRAAVGGGRQSLRPARPLLPRPLCRLCRRSLRPPRRASRIRCRPDRFRRLAVRIYRSPGPRPVTR